jgi:hypothetical protein
MGLLDDAIREHLALKRRRGADPAEVERAEREALGPVRRGPEAPDQGDLPAEEPLAYDHEEEEEWGESYDEPSDAHEQHLAEEPGAPAAGPSYFDEFEEPTSTEEFEERPPAASSEPLIDPESPPVPRPHAAPEPSHEHHGGETVEYEVEDALEQEQPDRGADDVLEETPDFLQDTPDHDRLWFEQKPPRDFDFDG